MQESQGWAGVFFQRVRKVQGEVKIDEAIAVYRNAIKLNPSCNPFSRSAL